MFETEEVILQMIQIYLAVGFSLGILYNIFRFIRLALPGLRLLAIILDLLFTITAGLVLFVFSAAYGMGYFRLYYILAAALGFTANMLTIGFAIPPLAKLSGKLLKHISGVIASFLKRIIRFIRQKSTKVFIKMGEIISKINEKCKIHLKKHYDMVYNNNDHKIGNLYKKGGETGNVIKAKVRKIG